MNYQIKKTTMKKLILVVAVLVSLASCDTREEKQHGVIGPEAINKMDEHIYTLRTMDTTSIHYQNKITMEVKVVKVY